MLSDSNIFWKIIVAVLVSYFVGLVLLTLTTNGGQVLGLKILATGIIVGSAAAVGGGVLGFLFGMPRTFARGDGPPAPSAVATGDEPETAEANSVPQGRRADAGADGWANNNLVEVSDWLTKIVVGVGLVQLSEIIGWLGVVGRAIGEGAGLTGGLAQSVGVTIIVANFGVGFLVTYIYSRTLLSLLFASASRQIEAELRGRLVEIEKSQKEQANATRKMQENLLEVASGSGGAGQILSFLYEPAPDGFENAIKGASALLDKEENENSALLWGYLACGLGQKYGYLRKQNRPQQELDAVEADGLEAVRRTVSLAPSRKAWLRKLWNPKDPDFQREEDDLVPFYEDERLRPRFAELLT